MDVRDCKHLIMGRWFVRGFCATFNFIVDVLKFFHVGPGLRLRRFGRFWRLEIDPEKLPRGGGGSDPAPDNRSVVYYPLPGGTDNRLQIFGFNAENREQITLHRALSDLLRTGAGPGASLTVSGTGLGVPPESVEMLCRVKSGESHYVYYLPLKGSESGSGEGWSTVDVITGVRLELDGTGDVLKLVAQKRRLRAVLSEETVPDEVSTVPISEYYNSLV